MYAHARSFYPRGAQALAARKDPVGKIILRPLAPEAKISYDTGTIDTNYVNFISCMG